MIPVREDSEVVRIHPDICSNHLPSARYLCCSPKISAQSHKQILALFGRKLACTEQIQCQVVAQFVDKVVKLDPL